MSETFRLGRLFGVRIGVNWSVVVILVLVVVGLAAGRFPVLYPDLPTGFYLAAGLVAGGVFLGSLLAHELAHAVVARRNGVEVEAITLWMFGGVAKLKGEPASPRADLWVAAVGPLVSVVLALLFTGVAVILNQAGVSGLVTGVVEWLALINGLLAAFNLVPAAPLDGGRILRAVWWAATGDRVRAAVRAAQAGRVFGWALIAGGIGLTAIGAGLGGVWFVLIGWFITMAAHGEEDYVRMQSSLAGVRVGEVMTANPVTVPAGTTVAEFVSDYVFTHPFSTFPIVDAAERPIGLLALRDVKRLPLGQREVTRVEDAAVPLPWVLVLAPQEPMDAAIERLNLAQSGRALVVDGDRIAGIVSPVDIVRRLEAAEIARG